MRTVGNPEKRKKTQKTCQIGSLKRSRFGKWVNLKMGYRIPKQAWPVKTSMPSGQHVSDDLEPQRSHDSLGNRGPDKDKSSIAWASNSSYQLLLHKMRLHLRGQKGLALPCCMMSTSIHPLLVTSYVAMVPVKRPTLHYQLLSNCWVGLEVRTDFPCFLYKKGLKSPKPLQTTREGVVWP